MTNTGNLQGSDAGIILPPILNTPFFRVCQVPYTHILHYENLVKEWRQFISDIGISEHIDLPWENKGAGKDLLKYFKTVSKEDKLELYNKFSTDFTMFGYQHEDF